MTQTADPSTLELPAELKPSDGRFGCGPSKVRRISGVPTIWG